MPDVILPPNPANDLNDLAARVRILEGNKVGNPTGGTAPNAPTTLLLASNPEQDPKDGHTVALVTASWTAPSSAASTRYYNIRYSYDAGTTWSVVQSVFATTAVLHGLVCNKTVTVGVRSVSSAGLQSAEITNTVTTQFDVTAPNAPSTPSLVAGPVQFTATWDGKDSVGATMYPATADLDRVEVHASQSTGFTPSAATRFGAIPNLLGGSYTSLVTSPGVWYVKFIAYDQTGNASSPSAQNSTTVLPAAVTSTSVGTLRNTDASMFQTPVTPGGLLVQTNATSNVDTTAFDGNNIGSGTVTSGSNAVLTTTYTALKPGQYRATFYMKVSTASGSAATTVCTLDITAASGVANNPQTITGAAFAANSRYFAITMPLFVTATSANVQLVVKQGSSLTAWNLSHVTIDTANDTPGEFIRAASIVDAKISNVSADKIIAGTITATVGIGTLGILRAGTAGAARVDITSAGINAYNSSNVNTFTVDSATGNVAVAGTFKTALSGTRIELSSTTADKINFYDATVGFAGAIYTYAGTTGIEASSANQNVGFNLDNSSFNLFALDNTSNGTSIGLPIGTGRAVMYSGGFDMNCPLAVIGTISSANMRYVQTIIATSETTASTTYANLTTVGPQCTVTVPPSGAIKVTLGAQMSNGLAGASCLASVLAQDLTNASTTVFSPSDNEAAVVTSGVAGNSNRSCHVFILGGLTAGHSILFSMQYHVTANTGTFLRRVLVVEPCL